MVVVGTERERFFRLRLETEGEFKGVLKPEALGIASTRLKTGVFTGVPSKPLAFLDGEERMLGSIFSESNSSVYGLDAANRRF